ncbi:MAG: hypothetical protein QM627_03240 [Luteolibacter sp.]
MSHRLWESFTTYHTATVQMAQLRKNPPIAQGFGTAEEFSVIKGTASCGGTSVPNATGHTHKVSNIIKQLKHVRILMVKKRF